MAVKKTKTVKRASKKATPGRPTKYTDELALKICSETASSSKSLKTICEESGTFVSTVFDWLTKNATFSEMYARAKELQADYLAEEMLEIAEHTEEDHTAFTGGNVVQRDKLRIETRKWIASKLKPRKYSDKIDLTTGGEKINETKTVVGLDGLSSSAIKELIKLKGGK